MKKILFIAVALTLTATFGFSQIKVVAPDGHTGIGVDAPTEKLEVGGNAKVNGQYLYLGDDAGFVFRRNTATGNPQSKFEHYGIGQYQFRAENNASITFWTNATLRLSVDKADGDLRLFTGDALKLGGGTWTALSDSRSKRDVKAYTDGLEQVLQIDPVEFKYKEEFTSKVNADKAYVGVIAQDMQKIAPYTVTEGYENINRSTGETTGDSYLAFDPNAITYMLVNAVKEQNELIEKQQKMIEQLQDNVDALILSTEATQGALNIEGTEDIQFSQNRPNPFERQTVIEYNVKSIVGEASIKVYDINGNFMKSYPIETAGKGSLTVTLNNVPDGVYTYSIVAGGKVIDTKKMILQN